MNALVGSTVLPDVNLSFVLFLLLVGDSIFIFGATSNADTKARCAFSNEIAA